MDTYIAPILLGSVGFTFFYLGIYILYTDRKIKKQGRKTLATVIDINEIESNDSVTYELILKFLGKNGEDVIQPLGFSSSIKPKRNTPYKIPKYYIEENGRYKLVLANNKLKVFIGICILFIGSAILVFFILHIFKLIDPFL